MALHLKKIMVAIFKVLCREKHLADVRLFYVCIMTNSITITWLIVYARAHTIQRARWYLDMLFVMIHRRVGHPPIIYIGFLYRYILKFKGVFKNLFQPNNVELSKFSIETVQSLELWNHILFTKKLVHVVYTLKILPTLQIFRLNTT